MYIRTYKSDDKYILEQDNGIKRKLAYSDNLPEILDQENLMFALENDKKHIISEKEKTDKILLKKYKTNGRLKWLLVVATCMCGFGLGAILSGMDKASVLSLFSASAGWGALYFCTKAVSDKRIKTWENIQNGNIAEEEYIEEQIEEEKNKLYALNLNKTYNNENEFDHYEVKTPDTKEIDNKRRLYNNIGRDFEMLTDECNYNEYLEYISSLSKEELEILREFIENHILDEDYKIVRRHIKDEV